ncbi:helix-turn-helix transcriptional regulator [Bacillus thuringiensis]|uniref:Transcriptional regulator n=1 Tax=Bacillus thuringiensis TaxID=1428 RepID=A0A9W3TJ01_BACTU|nr:helix-turn-helix transcriptional regulator [Bacillus thuringiensis]AQY42336.1 transcriptional regulator [Bacillus thuringiensis]MDR4150301.1 helix-turn-helix transcriptional regulator [Bacillus thuringiensis]MEC3574862.1 helix-turn-helix transcriptional regulator [Bacillus thuringiensis]MED2017075.1 helix-turn-helix transcriptional regulator [Bacillus thuringiensis]MED2143131.1 helix-turn-helix transcriptional regulator [Bacillus thuringiensis]
MKEFSKMLKKLRNSHNLTQEQLANNLSLSRSQIKNYENGFEPDLDALNRIATFFNVSVDVLLNRKNISVDESLNKTINIQQRIYATLNETQREEFCKQLASYAEFLEYNNKKNM